MQLRSTSLLGVLLLLGAAAPALAVPSFARQTGMTCAACHTVIPELTPFGREFKLNGYVFDNMKQIKGVNMQRRETLALNAIAPLSVMLQVSYTHTAKAVPAPQLPDGSNASELAKDGEVLFPQQASLFYAGKIADNLGAFVQLTYDGSADHFGFDNTDVRYARYLSVAESSEAGDGQGAPLPWKHDLLFGLTLNNGPTIQDPWNSTPAWGFPYSSSSVAPGPNASAQIDGKIQQNVAGLGAYVWFDHAWYAELSAYTAAKVGGNHPLDSTQAQVASGLAPYWRLGYEFRRGSSSLFLGTYGLHVNLLPGNGHPLNGPRDSYTDVAADVQYQYIGDDHLVTVLGTYIHEKQTLDGSFALGNTANASNTLRTLRGAVEYSYRRLIGGSAGFFSTTGTTDSLLYPNDGTIAGSLNGSADSRGYVLELNYLPFLNTKLQLQYVGYTRFNGAGTDYAGIGRNASDNNTMYLLVWLNF